GTKRVRPNRPLPSPHYIHLPLTRGGPKSGGRPHAPRRIQALDACDKRAITIELASPAALIVAQLHKLGDRSRDAPERLHDKDAHDLYRLLLALPTAPLADALRNLTNDPLAGQVTIEAIDLLAKLFANGPNALGAQMAGRAEQGIGDPATVSAATAALAQDLLNELQR
ncbi:MAG: hypothetical protein ACYCST_20745, partial [Acidimicrobiales bacterium]